MALFSMTCKVDSVEGALATEDGRLRAMEWMRGLGIGKVYLETYRHKHRIQDRELLCRIRDSFRQGGFEVSGCITPTQMSRRTATGWDICTCFTDPDGHRFLQEIVEFTAGIFDEIILDDFYFSSCGCPACEAYRSRYAPKDGNAELMREVAGKYILAPARRINPKCRFIIKYPCWYEGYYAAGYDVVRESELFDAAWIGTETREPDSPNAGRRPQTAASWIQGWANAVSRGKCGGGWFDAIDTKPETFVEQARQTILGGAKEMLIHCYDYIGTDDPGIVIHGRDRKIAYGVADADALRRETPALQKLMTFLAGMQPCGVSVPKQPNADPAADQYLPGFVGMLGIPVVPSDSLNDAPAYFLGAQCAGFETLSSVLKRLESESVPFVATANLLRAAGRRIPSEETVTLRKYGERSFCLNTGGDHWELMNLPQKDLDEMRNLLLEPFGIRFFAPSKVSLHLFRNGRGYCCAVENFRNESVHALLTLGNDSYSPVLCLPENGNGSSTSIGNGTYELKLAPRSFLLLSENGKFE